MWKWLMGRKLSTVVFNDPRAKTKTVLEMKCKKDSESSRFLAVSDSWCVLSQSSISLIQFKLHCTLGRSLQGTSPQNYHKIAT